MILILSDENDVSTEQVMDWLLYYDQKCIRLNRTDIITFDQLTVSDSGDTDFQIITQRFGAIHYSEITSFWYRRGYLQFVQFELSESIKQLEFSEELIRFFNAEMGTIRDFIYYLLEKKNSIGSIHHNDLNKLVILDKARSCGLKTPKSSVITKCSQIEQPQSSITKAVKEGFYYEAKSDYYYTSYTEDLNSIETIEDDFFPSLVQDKIDKLLEIRTFYLNGQCFSEAIFSQADQQTAVDFRRYNYVKPNRTVPFLLPQDVQDKIKNLMVAIGFKSGSLDLILDKNLEYYFLEVNPVGQFMQVSKPCNYFLERTIAKNLIV